MDSGLNDESITRLYRACRILPGRSLSMSWRSGTSIRDYPIQSLFPVISLRFFLDMVQTDTAFLVVDIPSFGSGASLRTRRRQCSAAVAFKFKSMLLQESGSTHWLNSMPLPLRGIDNGHYC